MQISAESVQKREDPYQLFLDSFKNAETKRKYVNWLYRFLKLIPSELFGEAKIPNYFKPVKKLLEMNNVPLVWRRVMATFPELDNNDKGRAYTRKEIADMLKFGNGAIDRAIVLVAASSGIRVGGFDLTWGDIKPVYRIGDKMAFEITESEQADAQYGVVQLSGICSASTKVESNGCLIATAAFGTELSQQVQQLRELRDNVLFNTESGTTFMTGFSDLYYTFSPAVADLERQSPLFKEVVKATITPMLSTMSILNYANIDSEQEMLGYGIGVILLNIGMYFVTPAIIIVKLRQKLGGKS